MPDITHDWLVGMIDGEGSFVVSISKRPNNRKPRVRPYFYISQADKEILNRIRDYLGVGRVKTGERCDDFVVDTHKGGFKIKNTFEDNPFLIKSEEFSRWSSVIEMIEDGRHLTWDGIKKINEIKPNPKDRDLEEIERGDKHQTNWSEKELQYLKENYPDKSLKQISEDLDRTYDAVRYKNATI